MLSEITNWIKQVIVVVIFTAFVDFLVPEDKFLRYVKVFLGILVVIAIINPLVPLLQKGWNIDEIPISYGNLMSETDIEIMSENISKVNKDLTINGYKEKLKSYIAEIIEEKTDKNANIEIEIDEDFQKNNFGRIKHIWIKLSDKKNSSVANKKIAIEPVKISSKITKQVSSNMMHENEFTDIKDYLSTVFDIPKDKIYIDLEE